MSEKLVAVRLPMELYLQACRYSDLYHTSVSALLREGLETRLNGTPAYSGIDPERLAAYLETAARELRKFISGDFDQERYYLGKLCDSGHIWGDTQQSLRRKSDHHCLECRKERKRR